MPYVGRAQAQKALIKALPDILEEVSRGRRRSHPPGPRSWAGQP